MFNVMFIEIIEGCGLSLEHMVLIGTFFFGLIFSAAEIRVAFMIWTLAFMGEFILFYLYNPTDTFVWTPALIAFLISIVLLVLSAFRTYSYKTRGII